MNLIEAERLARKIADVLEQRAPAGQGRQCAQEYAEVCSTANHRLHQCAGMMARNENALALQLADEAPPLLDLVTRLGFRQISDWREYCQAHELPLADPLDAKSIRQLGEAYGQGLAADHQLYRKYREAVMGRKEDEAVEVLRAIVRRNPADTNAPKELERLERKVLDEALAQLRLALDRGDDQRAVELIHEIEALNFAARPGGEVWQQAQKVRCQVLLRQAAQARTRGDWNAAAPLLPQVRTLRDEHEISLGEADARTQAELEAWVSERHQARDEDRKFHRTVAEWQQLVAASEAKNAAGDRLPRADLRHLIESLDRQWREVERFQRELNEDLLARSRKSLLMLRAQLAQRNRTLRNAWVAGLSAFVLLAIVASIFFSRQREARDAAGELGALTQNRSVAAVEKLLAQLRERNARPGGSTPSLRAALAASEQFLRVEHDRRQSAEASLTRLKEAAMHGFSNAPAADVQAQFELAHKLTEATANDLKPPLEKTLDPLRHQWERTLAEQKQGRLVRFDKILSTAKESADHELGYARGVEAVRATLAGLEAPLAELRLLAEPSLALLRLPGDAVTRLNSLQLSVASYSNEVARWDGIQRTWRQPGTTEDYFESLKQLQRAEFAAPDDKRRAGEALGLNWTMSAFVGELLLPAEPEAWARFERQPELTFTPPEVMPGERTRFNQLRDDENIFNLWQCEIARLPRQAGQARTTWTAYARGGLNRNRFGRLAGMVYDPVASPTLIEFKPREFDNYEFSATNVVRAPESEVFERVGLKALIDSQTGTNFGASLLGILDALNQETSGSPLFRAYLAVRAHGLMELRPNSWDAQWAPAARKDRLHLRELGAEAIASGDWLAPGRHADMGRRLEEHFSNARQTSYRAQAKFSSTLARRTLQSGFQLAGHTNAQGEPVLPSAPPDRAELWGWPSGGTAPALLFRYAAKERRFVAVVAPLPFTPLFRFREDRGRLLADVRRSISGRPAELGSQLPPFFAVALE